VGECGLVAGDGKPSLGGDLFAFFGDDRRARGTQIANNLDDLGGNGTFEIDRQGGVGDDGAGVFVVHVATVFAQMDGDLVGSGTCADSQCLQGIGVVDVTGFSEDGDVIDVDTEFHGGSLLVVDYSNTMVKFPNFLQGHNHGKT